MQFIYSRTSLFPGQRLALPPDQEQRVQTAAAEILYLTRPRWGVFRDVTASNLPALFLCATVISSELQKQEILTFIELMDAQASGWNFACAARALRVLFELYKQVEDQRTLDWWVVLKSRGYLDVSWYGI